MRRWRARPRPASRAHQRLPQVRAIEKAHADQAIPISLAGQPTLDIATQHQVAGEPSGGQTSRLVQLGRGNPLEPDGPSGDLDGVGVADLGDGAGELADERGPLPRRPPQRAAQGR